MTVTEIETTLAEAAVAWGVAVREAVHDTAATYGLDPALLLDTTTREGFDFCSTLDPLIDADPATEAFGRSVEAAVAMYAKDHPELVRVTEATETQEIETIQGRVLEARGTASDGGRVFRVEILRYGTSKNGNRYTEAVMRAAAPHYEGAKAYDHHRTPAELASSTVAGLVGTYRNVEATNEALVGDLHLMPSAHHIAEALDLSLANQQAGLQPMVGISHDVMAHFKHAERVGGRHVREATSITAVQSADVVADPSAGGRPMHAVESTTPEGDRTKESEVPVTKTDVLAAISQASDAELAAIGLNRAGTTTTESTTPPAPAGPAERVVEGVRATEAGALSKASTLGRLVLKDKAEQAGIDHRIVEAAITGDHFTEAGVDDWIASYKGHLAVAERAGLAPKNAPQASVTRESQDKRIARLDATFAGDYKNGYLSFLQAFRDFNDDRGFDPFSVQFKRAVMRESFKQGYDSADRVTESMSSGSWAEALGDSMHRSMMVAYTKANLQTWRRIVRIVPVADFKMQRRIQIGGYGTLPTVNEGQPYQPLTSPTDQEVTYALTKKGGTEDVTFEMIANDDIGAISQIPGKLGRAAARTVFEFVWGFLYNNSTYGPDSTALFHANHANTDTGSALGQSTLSTGRKKMRKQTAYGDTTEVLGLTPRLLVVPPDLEEIAFQLTKSAVAVPSTPAGPSDTPNIHSANGLDYVVVDSLTDTNDWFLVADPDDVPTIIVGFYGGEEDPALFTQADPNVGSVFNADKTTWKIRHIYNGAIEDFRGLYRGQG